MSEKSDPARGAFDVTPSDSTVLTGVRGLYVGGAGDVVVVTRDRGAAVTFKAVPVGQILPVEVVKVTAATTATFIVALT